MVLVEVELKATPERTVASALGYLKREDPEIWRPHLDKILIFTLSEGKRLDYGMRYRNQKRWTESKGLPFLLFRSQGEAREFLELAAFCRPRGGYVRFKTDGSLRLPEGWYHRNGRKLLKGSLDPFQGAEFPPERVEEFYRFWENLPSWSRVKLSLAKSELALEVISL